MNHFPEITKITDVLPHVEGDSAFRVIEKDSGHTFINYNHMGNDVFPPLPSDKDWDDVMGDEWETHSLEELDHHARIRRECRGIAFYTGSGLIASRPFHKFFNAGEREEVAIDTLPFNKPHLIMDKLDGSMIRPLMTASGFRWGTKMGVTDVGVLAEQYIAPRQNYVDAAYEAMRRGWTIIFEFVSRRNRIVVDYAEEDAILLAARELFSGRYIDRATLQDFAVQYDLPIVDVYTSDVGDSTGLDSWDRTTAAGSAEFFVRSVRQSSDIPEGVVVSFGDQFVKIKTETYSDLHAAKDKMATERRLIEVVLADNVDDLLPLLPDEDRDRLLSYVDSFWTELQGLAMRIESNYGMVRAAYGDKKSFALGEWAKANTEMRPIMFSLWDGKQDTAYNAAMAVMISALSSETKWQEAKSKYGFCTEWNEKENVE